MNRGVTLILFLKPLGLAFSLSEEGYWTAAVVTIHNFHASELSIHKYQWKTSGLAADMEQEGQDKS